MTAEKKLTRPIFGDTEANMNQLTQLCIFLKDESFISPDASRNAVGLLWREIMEDQIGPLLLLGLSQGQKNEVFTLKPQRFKAQIEEGTGQTAGKRANDRARMDLERRARVEPSPTVGELKRAITKKQCQNEVLPWITETGKPHELHALM